MGKFQNRSVRQVVGLCVIMALCSVQSELFYPTYQPKILLVQTKIEKGMNTVWMRLGQCLEAKSYYSSKFDIYWDSIAQHSSKCWTKSKFSSSFMHNIGWHLLAIMFLHYQNAYILSQPSETLWPMWCKVYLKYIFKRLYLSHNYHN